MAQGKKLGGGIPEKKSTHWEFHSEYPHDPLLNIPKMRKQIEDNTTLWWDKTTWFLGSSPIH
jgi:hypothetical protein